MGCCWLPRDPALLPRVGFLLPTALFSPQDPPSEPGSPRRPPSRPSRRELPGSPASVGSSGEHRQQSPVSGPGAGGGLWGQQHGREFLIMASLKWS